jgi:hypothetical protein
MKRVEVGIGTATLREWFRGFSPSKTASFAGDPMHGEGRRQRRPLEIQQRWAGGSSHIARLRAPTSRWSSDIERTKRPRRFLFQLQAIADDRTTPTAEKQRRLTILEQDALSVVGQFRFKELSQAFNLYGKMRLRPGQAMLIEMESQIAARIGDFGSQGISNVIVGYAKIGEMPGKEALSLLEARAAAIAGEFNAQNFANTLWAFAKLGIRPGSGSLSLLEERAAAVAEHFKAQEISNSMWAYAKLGIKPGAGLLPLLEMRAVAVAGRFKAQEFSNTMWAYATLELQPDLKLVSVLESKATAIVNEFNPQNVANALWAYGTLGIEPQSGLLRLLECRAESLVGDFNPQNIANTLWAFGALGLQPGTSLIPLMEERAAALAGKFETRGIASMLWAYATLDTLPSGNLVLLPLCHVTDGCMDIDSLDDRSIQQLHMYLLFCQLELESKGGRGRLGRHPDLAHVENLSNRLTKRRQSVHCATAHDQNPHHGSNVHRRAEMDAVSSSLRRLGFEFEQDAVDERSGYSIDILIKAAKHIRSGTCSHETCGVLRKGVALAVGGPGNL